MRRKKLAGRAREYARENFGGQGAVSPTHLRRIAAGSFFHGYHDARRHLAEMLGLTYNDATIVGLHAIPATDSKARADKVFCAVDKFLKELP